MCKPGTPEYGRLERKWYDRLAREGFEDIERTHDGDVEHDSPFTRGHPLRLLRSWERGTWHRNEEWYRLAGHHLHDRDWSLCPAWAEGAWERLCAGATLAQVHRYVRRRSPRLTQARLRRWLKAEERVMAESNVQYSYACTARSGEIVYVKGILRGLVGDYEWEMELTDGNTIRVTEDDLVYK